MLYLKVISRKLGAFWICPLFEHTFHESEILFLEETLTGFERPQEAQRFINKNFERIDNSISVFGIPDISSAQIFDDQNETFTQLKLPQL